MFSKLEIQPRHTRLNLSPAPLLSTNLPPPISKPKTNQNIVRTILVLTLTASIPIIWTTFHFSRLQPPTLHLSSLTLSNLVVSDKSIAATWQCSLTIRNPSLVFRISFDRIETFVFYEESDFLATSLQEPFSLETGEEKTENMEIRSNGLEEDQPIVEYPVLRRIGEDKKAGKVRFSVRTTSWGRYEAVYWSWSQEFAMNSYCMDLDVEILDSDAGDGRLVDSNSGSNRCFSVLMPNDYY